MKTEWGLIIAQASRCDGWRICHGYAHVTQCRWRDASLLLDLVHVTLVTPVVKGKRQGTLALWWFRVGWTLFSSDILMALGGWNLWSFSSCDQALLRRHGNGVMTSPVNATGPRGSPSA